MGKTRAIIIGSGIGGLAAAMRLASSGIHVKVIEKSLRPGGKIRTLESISGPVDAGPTVLTMPHVFRNLYYDCKANINDHLELNNEETIARHWWRDDSTLDLYSCFEKNIAAIRAFSGQKSAREFEKFHKIAKSLFGLFEDPIINSTKPRILPIILKGPKHTRALYQTLIRNRNFYNFLSQLFSDYRLRQLFARYSTYVGGSPFLSPSILSLIWNVESRGVWRIKGGMHKLPKSMEKIAKDSGAEFHYGCLVDEILVNGNQATGVRLANGQEMKADFVVFNGDPIALKLGLLGRKLIPTVREKNLYPRSLSAYVWSFAAQHSGRELIHHNVFFNQDYATEFKDIKDGRMPKDPTLYICAQGNRKEPIPRQETNGRFEIILNAPPVSDKINYEKNEEYQKCKKVTFTILESMGLKLKLKKKPSLLTTPADFGNLFPGSMGSLYGKSPHGLLTTFRKPIVRSRIKGLFLVGGGVHPGAGIPMACQSGKHAAEMILKNQGLM